ncbi:hypothetical protein Ac2012v2_002839 [Leucoagaricus gongylophorus]
MFVFRFIVFDLQESSKYLIAQQRDVEAVQVLEHIAKRNGKTISLRVEHLLQINVTTNRETVSRTTWQVLRPSFSLSHVRPLFSGKRMAVNSSITILSWALIGLAYPLFNSFLPLYLSSRFASASSIGTTYRNYAIISALGVPGSLIACFIVDWTRKSNHAADGLEEIQGDNEGKIRCQRLPKRWSVWQGLTVVGGRKLTMAVSTLLTGVFLFLFTTSQNQAAVLGYSCASGLTQNAMYGVLFAYTPEVFPAPHRGTGDAMASSINRVTGILAPIIKIVTTTPTGAGSNGTANSSVFVSAALLTVTAFFMIFLPIETAGRAAM